MGLWDFFSWASLLVLGLAVICFLLYCAYIHSIHLKYDHIPGPPRDNFLMGHSPTFIKMAKDNVIVYDLLLDWVLKYGPVIRINGFHQVFIVVANPDGIKELLMSSKHPKDRFYEDIFYLFGVRFLMGLMGTFNDKAEELMEKLVQKADGESEIKMHDMFNKVTLDVIAKVAFDMDLNALHDDQTPFPQAILMAMKGMIEMRNPLIRILPFKRTIIREIRESVLLLRKTGKECIERRLKMVQEGSEVPGDILTQILKGAALENDCDNELMIDNFVTFFIAGQETTANQLAFAVQSLGQHLDILKKAQAEVDEVIGSKRDIEYEDLGKLHYLSQVLKETLRLYPSVPGTSRLTSEELVVEGLRIPKNSSVLVNTYITGRMEQFFPDPLSFNPDRFSPDAPKPYYTYFPFSLGPRNCIGQTFSQMEARVMMAKLLQRFDFELVPGQTFKILDTGTLRPMDGVRCRLKLRGKH